jgi:hypothetical protein
MKTSKKKNIITDNHPSNHFDGESSGRYVLSAIKYGVMSPDQVKMRILWENIRSLVKVTFGETPENKKIMDAYQLEWKLAEEEECRVLRKVAKAYKKA